MASITDIKRRILELAPAPFQEFCDTLISKHEYGVVHGYGMKAGTGNTTKGNPDTYFRKENGKYVFIVYTIQQANIYTKIKEDIEKCFDSSKTGVETKEIDEIICCHTSSNLSAGDDKKLHDLCEEQGIVLTIWGIDELAKQVHNQFRSMAKDYLGLSIDTNQILSIDEFVSQYDANSMAAPLNTLFQFREKEKAEIINALGANPIVILTGKAGVGKTRLALEVIRNVALNDGYKLLCVKNNNLGLYEDLISATEHPDKYLFFIDDANELADLGQILAYTTKRSLGYEVKILVTVRDYAKAKVLLAVKDFAFPQIIEIPSFTDDEIKGLLNENFQSGIEDYVDQIIRIAEGNPRIAYMAGRLAVEKRNLTVIKDASQLYDAYYEKYVDSVFGSDNDLCFTAGILSVVNAVILDDLSVLHELLKQYGITLDTFKEKILLLSRLEVVEIHLDQVASMTDQCLSNYLLYYVFFMKKLISFSCVLETGYRHFRNGVIRTINTLLNIFESDTTKEYCKQEIITVWEHFKVAKDKSFYDFVKDFHIFRPEEAFLIAHQIIENISSYQYDAFSVDFLNNAFCPEESILAYLTGYQYSQYLEYVMELLLDYCSKTEKTLVSGYKWLENNYGIDGSVYVYKFYNQKKISDYLYNAILQGNATAIAVGFQWAKYSLNFTFHHTEMGKGNAFIFYDVDIVYSEDLAEYRGACWGILEELAADLVWKDKILNFIDSYAVYLQREPDQAVVSGDTVHVEKLLSALKCKKIRYLIAVQKLLFNGKRIHAEYNAKWAALLKGTEWNLFQLVEDNYLSSGMGYEEYKNKRYKDISEYGKNIELDDVPCLVKSMNSIMSEITINDGASYRVNQGFEIIVQQFDDACLLEFMRAFIYYGSHLSIRPGIVLKSLNNNGDSVQLLSLINQKDFPQKNEWLFSFFETLPVTKADSQMMQKLLSFLRSDSDKTINESPFRSLRVLDKFLEMEKNIYPIACAYIYAKREYSPFIVGIYFNFLFHDQIYTPEELLSLFSSDMPLLQEIYFYRIKEGQLDDLNGTFLITFLENGKNWIHNYSEVFWDHVASHKNYDHGRNCTLWKSDNYQEYFDYIFDHCPERELYSWRFRYGIKYLMVQEKTDDIIRRHQLEWIKHIISVNAESEKIVVIFRLICELNNEIRTVAIQTFLDNNQNYEIFSKLPLVPGHWSATNSLIPVFEKEIIFLESLYKFVPGIKFLRHKTKIKSEVETLQKMIREEELKEIYRDLYM